MTTTKEFRQEIGIKDHESPRSYASPLQLSMVNMFESSVENMAKTTDTADRMAMLTQVGKLSELLFLVGEMSGAHKQIPRSKAIEPVPASEVSEEERFVGPSHYVPLLP